MPYSDLDYLRPFAISSDPVLPSAEIEDELDVTQQGAYDRLMSLVSKGYLDTKKVGAKARVFWLTDDGRRYVSDSLRDTE